MCNRGFIQISYPKVNFLVSQTFFCVVIMKSNNLTRQLEVICYYAIQNEISSNCNLF